MDYPLSIVIILKGIRRKDKKSPEAQADAVATAATALPCPDLLKWPTRLTKDRVSPNSQHQTLAKAGILLAHASIDWGIPMRGARKHLVALLQAYTCK